MNVTWGKYNEVNIKSKKIERNSEAKVQEKKCNVTEIVEIQNKILNRVPERKK